MEFDFPADQGERNEEGRKQCLIHIFFFSVDDILTRKDSVRVDIRERDKETDRKRDRGNERERRWKDHQIVFHLFLSYKSFQAKSSTYFMFAVGVFMSFLFSGMIVSNVLDLLLLLILADQSPDSLLFR